MVLYKGRMSQEDFTNQLAFLLTATRFWRQGREKMIFDRSHRLLNLKDFSHFSPPMLIPWQFSGHLPSGSQHILRMMVQRPGDARLTLPQELQWLRSSILACASVQSKHGLQPDRDFIYVTVRHGLCATKNDDSWHVDGFSMRFPHRPEQNYIWSNVFPTEVLHQPFSFPDRFDPKKHNIHLYIQDHADESLARPLRPCSLYVIDPYIPHRRPKVAFGTWRSFFRISFVPIEIEDDTCQQNPLLPRKIYGRDGVREVRDKLTRCVE